MTSATGSEDRKVLPLTIEGDIIVRSLEQKHLQAKTRILGARHGDFILIEEPICRINERMTTPIGGNILCSFFHEGDMYRFASKIRKPLEGGLTLIDYPMKFHIENVRKSHRIQVNIEVRVLIEKLLPGGSAPNKQQQAEAVKGTMVDVSEGGCFLVIPMLVHVMQNMFCILDFVLPNDQPIAGLQTKVRKVDLFKLRKTTELGLQFIGPPEQLALVSSFCQYCMYFKA